MLGLLLEVDVLVLLALRFWLFELDVLLMDRLVIPQLQGTGLICSQSQGSDRHNAQQSKRSQLLDMFHFIISKFIITNIIIILSIFTTFNYEILNSSILWILKLINLTKL